ncbi:MAG: LamG-like jellyroll fold domain-containing protein [Planctomycetota bacterium]|nr:LamG-like jellyroll fold domain-containing protein [Planctomycetota bacterium]
MRRGLLIESLKNACGNKRVVRTPLAILAACLTLTPVVARQAAATETEVRDNIGHTRHTHHHNPKHPTEAPTPARFVTSRASDVVLPLPQEKDAFTFVVFGDRTGGPVDGVKVLADAVRDANLFEPDLVMTVGDLINGYNTTDQWMEQMREYKQIMGELRCPWFPVVGNHDVYWRGPNRPPEEHEVHYEANFGPLWYAFKHKNAWFIALHSDEANPETGERNFNNPENHKMSEAQFSWLRDTLAKAKDADHVFLFLHHPRWTGGRYGDGWDRVHQLLVSAGNVTAVFAGHIHRMRYDPKDGIEYVTLATVGGGQSGLVPEAGWLHHFHVVTVRKDQVAMAGVPVGETMNVREITAQFADECAAFVQQEVAVASPLMVRADGSTDATVTMTLANPTSRPVDVNFTPDSPDARWVFTPDHRHGRMEPGSKMQVSFQVRRPAGHADAYLRLPELVVNADVLMPTHRYSMPEKRVPITLDLSAMPDDAAFDSHGSEQAGADLALRLDGDDAVLVANDQIPLPDGPFTLECWFKADDFNPRTGLLCKTQASDYGIFVNDGRLEFSVFLGDKYASARTAGPVLATGRWHHVAGVFDGSTVRVFLDGKLAAETTGSGARKQNKLPLVIGADVDGPNRAVSHFSGKIDAVRLTPRALYTGAFTPERRLAPEADTVLLTNMDRFFAGGLWGQGKNKLVGTIQGEPTLVPAD